MSGISTMKGKHNKTKLTLNSTLKNFGMPSSVKNSSKPSTATSSHMKPKGGYGAKNMGFKGQGVRLDNFINLSISNYAKRKNRNQKVVPQTSNTKPEQRRQSEN